jgi:hypothetical protein
MLLFSDKFVELVTVDGKFFEGMTLLSSLGSSQIEEKCLLHRLFVKLAYLNFHKHYSRLGLFDQSLL